MAGDWIKMTHSLRSAPEVVRISSACNADKMRTIGALYVLWCIADMHAEDDGTLDGYSLEAVDAEVGIPGFASAVVSAGWLESGDKYLRLPNFHHHNGHTAKRRAQESRRKASARDADILRTDRGQSADQRREEKRERRTTTTAASPLGGGGDSKAKKNKALPEGAAILADFGINPAVALELNATPTTARAFIKASERMKGIRDARAWVVKAIRGGWDVEDPDEVKRTQAALRDARREEFERERARKRHESLHGVNGHAKEATDGR